ncbi:MAG: CPBP family intramembrane glutamic endopeptidase [Erythrobacter sp.]
MAKSTPRVTLEEMAVFAALAFALAWGWWGWLWVQGALVEPGSHASHLPGLLAPMVAATLARAWFGGRKALAAWIVGLLRSWPLRRADLWVLLVAPLAVAWTVWLVSGASGADALLRYPGLPETISPLAGVALVLVVNGWGEEAGWRGLLHAGLRQRFSLPVTALLVGLVWALWHAPIFAIHSQFAAMLGWPLMGWLISLLAGAPVLGWLFERSGGAVAYVAWWHTLFNYATAPPPLVGASAMVVSALVLVGALAILRQELG